MANFTRSDLQVWLDAPPSYEELFGPPEPEETPSAVKEYEKQLREQEEASARRLQIDQNRFLVRDTRASPPEAPHFVAPDLRPWMRDRSEGSRESQSSDSNQGQTTHSTPTITGRQSERREVNRSNRPNDNRVRTNQHAAEMALYPQRRARTTYRPQHSHKSQYRGCTVD